MRGTKALGSLKGLLPPIHPPLPLNKRESQQLLTALTSSFRKNLDQEHGYTTEDSFSSTFNTRIPSISNTSAQPLSSNKDLHRRPTDRHVRAILSNPLFSYDQTIQPSAARPRGQRDPMDVFDEAVAKGMMTVERAAGVLKAKRQAIIQSSSFSIKETLATSATALRVVQWLRASGLERNLSFISSLALMNPLLKFMNEEGLDEIAWGWLERLVRGEGPQVFTNRPGTSAAYVLDSLIAARMSGNTPLNEAYACILRADDMFKDSPAFQTTTLTPWRQLSFSSTNTVWKRYPPSEALFESFVAISGHLRGPSLVVDRAHLALHHPTNPSAEEAISQLKSEQLWKILERMKETFSAVRPTSLALRVAYMGLDSVQHLSKKGDQGQAEWIMDLMTTRLGEFLGPNFDNADRRFPTG